MCLAIPAKLIEVNGMTGTVDVSGVKTQVGLALVEDVKPGDYIITHAGYALQKLDIEEAEKRIQLFKELAERGTGSA